MSIEPEMVYDIPRAKIAYFWSCSYLCMLAVFPPGLYNVVLAIVEHSTKSSLLMIVMSVYHMPTAMNKLCFL